MTNGITGAGLDSRDARELNGTDSSASPAPGAYQNARASATRSASYRGCCLLLAVSTSWATRSWSSPVGTSARNCCHDFTAPA